MKQHGYLKPRSISFVEH